MTKYTQNNQNYVHGNHKTNFRYEVSKSALCESFDTGCTSISEVHLRHCTQLHCNTQRSIKLQCAELLYPTLHCNILYYTALHCTALQCTPLYCTAMHCAALNYSKSNSM